MADCKWPKGKPQTCHNLFVYCRYWLSPCFPEAWKISHSLQLIYFQLFQKAVSILVTWCKFVFIPACEWIQFSYLAHQHALEFSTQHNLSRRWIAWNISTWNELLKVWIRKAYFSVGMVSLFARTCSQL